MSIENIMIPIVDAKYTHQYIADVFWNQQILKVSSITLLPFTNKKYCKAYIKVAAGHQGSNAEYSNSGNGGNGVDTYDTSTSTPVTISGGTISQWYTIPSSGGGGGSGLSPNANWLEESYDAGTSGNAGTNTTFPNLAPFPYASQGRAGTKNSAINCNDSIMPDSCSQGSYLPSSTSGAPGKLSVCCYDNTQKLTYGGFGGGGIYKNPYWLTGNNPLILIYYQTSIS